MITRTQPFFLKRELKGKGKEIDHTIGDYVPYTIYEQCVSSLTSHKIYILIKGRETGPTVYHLQEKTKKSNH